MLVMQDRAIKSHVSLHQIIYLIENLGSIHSNNAFILKKISIAKDMFSTASLNTLLEIAATIISLPDLDKATEHKHAVLVKETKELANILYAKMALSAQEYISQTYLQGGRYDERAERRLQQTQTQSQTFEQPHNQQSALQTQNLQQAQLQTAPPTGMDIETYPPQNSANNPQEQSQGQQHSSFGFQQ